MLVTLSTANSFGILGCKTMSILSSRDNMSVWSLRPMWETLVCKVPPPPRTWGYCPLREVPSKPVMFQSSWDKACVPWEADLLLLCLALFMISCLWNPLCCFHCLCKAPFIWTAAGTHFPPHIQPESACGNNSGECWALPMDRHLWAVCCANPRLLATLEECLQFSKCKVQKLKKNVDFSIPIG